MEKTSFYELSRKMILRLIREIQPQLKELGLYPGQETFLSVIYRNEGISLIEISNMTERKRSTITNSVKSLEKGGFIRREVASEDKRKYHLYLTPKGRAACESIDNHIKKILRKCESCLSKEEKKILENVLRKINQELEGESLCLKNM